MALITRTQAASERAAARTAKAAAEASAISAHNASIAAAIAAAPAATGGAGRAVRTRVAAKPAEWALTQVACDTDTAVALLSHISGLWCPVCGARYDHLGG